MSDVLSVISGGLTSVTSGNSRLPVLIISSLIMGVVPHNVILQHWKKQIEITAILN